MTKPQRIIYTTPEGGVAVIIPTGELPIDQVLAKDVPPGATGLIVDADVIPSDRSFRSAWKQEGRAIGHDMAVAREIHRNHIREVRSGKLIELDVQFQREMEKQKPNPSAIIARKQALRDATANQSIEDAGDIDSLKAAWDADLLGPSPYV